jgi:hypothetical protein
MTTRHAANISARFEFSGVIQDSKACADWRNTPLYVELELYFSCLVKKFVHFRDDSRGKPTVPVGDKLLLYFRPVTSTSCTWDVADRLGRQPEMDIDCEALHHVAPKRVFIDHVAGQWRGSYGFL